MSERRNRPPNRWGCKPDGDVCVQHDTPLICPHGCDNVRRHACKFRNEQNEALDRKEREFSASTNPLEK